MYTVKFSSENLRSLTYTLKYSTGKIDVISSIKCFITIFEKTIDHSCGNIFEWQNIFLLISFDS